MNYGIGQLLKKEFEVRKSKNEKYSLRAFSRDLNMSPGFLSEILQNKKRLSLDKTLKVTDALGWSLRDSRIFLQSSQLGHAKTKKAKTFLKSEIKESSSVYAPFSRLKLTQFSSVSDWYYLAIMQLTERAEYSDDPKWVSAQLCIPVETARSALEKLKANRLISMTESGRWVKTMDATVRDVPTSEEIRKFHRQHLQNAARAIENQSTSERHISGVTMTIDKSKWPEAIAIIAEFRARMSAVLESGDKHSVYHLGIQLFQLDDGKLKAGELSK